MTLTLGIMKNEELATWFNIKLKTFKDGRKKYLSKLKSFAKFTEIRGGVVIEEIYIPTYVKNLDDDVKLYLQEAQKAEDNITSISGISELLCAKEEFNNVGLRTMEGRMARAGIKAFGITKEEESRGIYGSREYVWAIKLYDAPNHYRYMTREEEQRFDEIIVSFYTSSADRVKKAALLEEAFKSDTSMTKEQYFEAKERLNLNVFTDVIWQFKSETGLQIVKATAHDIDENYKESAF